MMRIFAWLLLLTGVVLGATGAARHGAAYEAYRASIMRAAAASAEETTVRETPLPLPSPSVRLYGWFAAGGTAWSAGLVLVVAGAWLARRDLRARQRQPRPGETRVSFTEGIEQVLTEIDALVPLVEALAMDAPSATVRERLDRLQDEILTPIVESRHALIVEHGLSDFAVYFGSFSAGERNLARAWSALTDGHTPTAASALHAARQAFLEARAAHLASVERLDPNSNQ
jgi:hypothetical protein